MLNSESHEYDLAIVLLNYNNTDFTVTCVNSIIANLQGFYSRIVILDNGSNETEYNNLKKACLHGSINILRSEINLGFTKGYNQAIKKIQNRFIWILNNDSWIKSSVGLVEILKLLSKKTTGLVGNSICLPNRVPTPNVGLSPTFTYILLSNIGLGKRLRRYGLYGFAQKISTLFPAFSSLSKIHEFNTPGLICETATVSGCSMFTTKENFDEVGGFDEEFFIYDEDTDLSVRYTSFGLKNYHVSNFIVYTIPHSATMRDPKFFNLVRYRSRLHFINKHFFGIKKFILLTSMYLFPKKW